jgi:hypothetical protein
MTIFFSDLFLIERSQWALSKKYDHYSDLESRRFAIIKFFPRFSFYPDEKIGMFTPIGSSRSVKYCYFGLGSYLHQSLLLNPVVAAAPDFFIGTIADNGTAVSEAILSVNFQ